MLLTQALEAFEVALSSGFSLGLKIEAPKSARTIEAYVGAVRRTLTASPVHWDHSEIAEWLGTWRKAQHALQLRGKLGRSKVALDIAGLRKFYHWAHATGLVSSNPMDSLQGVPAVRRLPRPIAAADLERIRDVCKITQDSPIATYRMRALVECFMNGLRRIETVRLDINNVWVESGTTLIQVRRKGGTERIIPLNHGVASYLLAYILEQHEPEWRSLLNPESEDAIAELFAVYSRWYNAVGQQLVGCPVFVHNGTRVLPNTINFWFRKLKQAAGVSRNWGPHSLRHAFATRLLNNGVDIRVVQELLSHATIAQTQLYTEVMSSTSAGAVQLLDAKGVF